MNLPPLMVGELIRRLRRMLGHLSAKDRQTVLNAIGGLEELATRLYNAEHPTPPAEGRVTITRAAEDEQPHGEEAPTPEAADAV